MPIRWKRPLAAKIRIPEHEVPRPQAARIYFRYVISQLGLDFELEILTRQS